MDIRTPSIFAATLAAQLAASAAMAQTSPPPFGPVVQPHAKLTPTDMTSNTPLIPADIYRDAKVSGGDLATFAWLEFISAVSPAAAGQRGVPGGSFAASGSAPGGGGPLVWETYQHRTELFPCNVANGNAAPAPPQPWGTPPNYVTTVSGSAPQTCSTIALSGGALPYNNLDESSQIGQNYLFFPATPGSPQPASDAQVLFEAKVNQYESNYVNQNYKSLIPNQKPFYFSSGVVNLPTGAVEVKAAWRPLASIPQAQQYRYHTASVITYSGSDASPTPQVQTYALLALHIIHKTPNYPAFIFATFEQEDDFQNQATKSPTGVYYVPTYGTIAYTAPATTTFPPSGKTVDNPKIKFDPASPKAYPNGKTVALPLGNVTSIPGAVPVQNGVAVPVTQPVPTSAEVSAVNKEALAVMQKLPGFGPNFTWQYYQLAGVQAIPTSDDTTRDFYLANIVVESSQPGIQLFRGFPPSKAGTLTNVRNQANVIDEHGGAVTSMGGCQGCHGIAQTQTGADFSFLFLGAAGGGFSPETVGLPASSVSAVRLQVKKYLQ